MKRIIALALVACFVLGAGMANAKELQVKAQFHQALEFTDNTDFVAKDDNEDDYRAIQRVRMYFHYVTDETLRGVVGFEIDSTWGQAASAGNIGADVTNLIELKNAYVDFATGPVTWRTGIQGISWPSAVIGNPVLSDDMSGIVASYSFNEMVSLVTGYVRAVDDGVAGGTGDFGDADAVTAILPIAMDGYTVTPWVIYAQIGQDATGALDTSALNNPAVAATDGNSALWLGGALEVTAFDPITFGLDLVYGSVNAEEEANDRSGWYAAGIATYKMDMVTPSLAVIYGSGEDDDNTNGSETLPALSSGAALTHFGMDGGSFAESANILGARSDRWAMALILDDISFVENLTHKFIIMYGGGTSDENAAGVLVPGTTDFYTPITEKDNFLEINFDSTYAIYENLSLSLMLGYVSLDRDEDTWGAANSDLDDATKALLYLNYSF